MKYHENMTEAEIEQLLAEIAELDAAYGRAEGDPDGDDADGECEADQYHYWRP